MDLQSLPDQLCQALITYIPNGAEIIALDAFDAQADDLVDGITSVKPALAGKVPPSLASFLLQLGVAGGSLLKSVAQNCFSLELLFAPYHLFQTPLPASCEIVWLLCGGDEQRTSSTSAIRRKRCSRYFQSCTSFLAVTSSGLTSSTRLSGTDSSLSSSPSPLKWSTSCSIVWTKLCSYFSNSLTEY
ncbi:uncharacterized protein LOC135948228 [Cloeon dipterum]|uniref:uncharacterized protein LOC135947824 n=1 Tax=Cloeon dipterum TaxID=197152 RepID=UPI0032205A29